MNSVNDNELEKVTGGISYETLLEDYKLLKAKGLVDKEYKGYDILDPEAIALIKEGWAKVGIFWAPKFEDDMYCLGNFDIGREEARKLLQRY